MPAMDDPAAPASNASDGLGAPQPLTLGDYRLEAPMFVDEVGVTYRARALGEAAAASPQVALHVPRVELQRDERFQRRYGRDADEARTFNQPNLLPVLAAGQDSGLAWRAQAWVEGWDLSAVMDRCPGGALDVMHLASVGVQLCQALVYLHERADDEGTPSPLMHGNISLSQVLLCPDGRLVLLGLPSARGRANTGYGRQPELDPAELAPEHLRSGMLGPRSDLYQVALLIYSMWIGASPLRAASRDQTLAAVMQGVGPLRRGDQLPRQLKVHLEQALSVDPSQRPASARQMLSILESVAGGLGDAALRARWASTLENLFSGKAPTRVAAPGLTSRVEVQRLAALLETPALLPDLAPDPSWALEETTDVVTREELEAAAALLGVGLPPSPHRPSAVEQPVAAPEVAPVPVEQTPAPVPVPLPVPVLTPPAPSPKVPTPRAVSAPPRSEPVALPPDRSSRAGVGWLPLFVGGGILGLILGLWLWPSGAPTVEPVAGEPVAVEPVQPAAAKMVQPEADPVEEVAPEPAAPEPAAPEPEVVAVAAPVVAPVVAAVKAPVSASVPSATPKATPKANTTAKSAVQSTQAPIAAVVAPPAPTPAPVAAPVAAPEVSAPKVHLTDVSVSAAGGTFTVTGRVDSDSVRPLGFLLEGGAKGPQYVVRYKGVAASVASRELSVSSTAVRAVRVAESGGDTTITVDLAPGVEVTPRLRRDAGGFVLTIESSVIP